jgi:leader peptidase (prepilin peptidase)/N-methyltransferase
VVKKYIPFAGPAFICALYLALCAKSNDIFTLVCGVLLIVFGFIAAYLDLRTRKIPNKLVLLMLGAWLAAMAVYVIADIESAVTRIMPSLTGGAAAGGFFLLLYLVSRKGVGGGDVKFIAASGLYLTFARLMPALFFSSLLAALASAVLLLTKRATVKTAIPLAPFLYAGILLTLFL